MAYEGPERRAEPLTEEQLNLIGEETRRAANKVLHNYRRTAIVGFLVLLLANAYVWYDSNTNNQDSREAIVQSGQVVSVSGCNRDFRTTQALHAILQTSDDFNQAAAKKGDITQAQADEAHTYYQQFIKSLPLPDCKAAGDVLTSETGDVPPTPKPLTP